jgi:hypothetical protein
MGPGSNVGGMRQVRGGSAIYFLVSSRCSSPRCQRCSRAVLVRRRNGEMAATMVVTAAGNSGDVNSMKGFVLQPCDLICEPASPALSEARERQVAKSAAVINPSRLHPTLRRDPLRSPLFFSSWGKYLLHESERINLAGVASLLHFWQHLHCYIHSALYALSFVQPA